MEYNIVRAHSEEIALESSLEENIVQQPKPFDYQWKRLDQRLVRLNLSISLV